MNFHKSVTEFAEKDAEREYKARSSSGPREVLLFVRRILNTQSISLVETEIQRVKAERMLDLYLQDNQ